MAQAVQCGLKRSAVPFFTCCRLLLGRDGPEIAFSTVGVNLTEKMYKNSTTGSGTRKCKTKTGNFVDLRRCCRTVKEKKLLSRIFLTFDVKGNCMLLAFRHTKAFLQHLFPALVLSNFGTLCWAQNPVMQSGPEKKDTLTQGFKPNFGTDAFYVAYVGASYNIVKYRGNKQPYAASYTVGLNYSPILNSLHPYLEMLFPQAVGKWDLAFNGGYDGLRRMNYYGLGNESPRLTTNNRFNWMRTRNQYATLGLSRRFAKYHRLNLSLSYDGIQVLNDENRYIAKTRSTIDPASFDWQNFLGGRLSYTFTKLDNEAFPIKGIDFTTSGGYTGNLKRSGHSFARFTTDLEAYIPLPAAFSIAIRTGAATLTGNPDFYQYNTIGGGKTLRGFRRWRYFGKTSFYNQNELRWVTHMDLGSINGHLSFLTLYDLGRVWQPGEVSDKWHIGYGAGIILAPFDKIWVTTVYAFTPEENRFHFTVKRSL